MLKNKCIINLTYLTDEYQKLLHFNIVRIQRWYRALRRKFFFKNLLRNERKRLRDTLNEQLSDMETSITRLRQNIEKR